ncbi:tetratricopeptide repeat-containing sensor histidine kinase [Flavobacterium cellulosilyticum]|uniref:ATP-binding protein n=1 Tax=Flavobacterium cellulosilyticum TaxID=2541731 RepID=A0A4R5CAF9_9FLAO|nr:ATP-binding protein [Flavobacterium cellulosilyticum]TDD95180.1 ATP-binding protein [Flavobacterium cellulosilyticum]
MSEIQQNQGDYSGSEATAIEALPYLNNTIDPAYECSLYNLLGIVNVKLFEYDNAIEYYTNGLKLKIDDVRKLKLKHNIAVAYMAKDDYNRAIQILLPLTLKKEVINEPASFAKAVDNLGFSYFKVGSPLALAYLKQALKIKKQKKDDNGIVTSYIHLTNFYNQTNQKLAFDFAQKAYEKATKVNSVDKRLESLALLIQNGTGNQTKTYSEKYVFINDSITKVRQKAKNQFAKIKYDSKKDKEENLVLKTQKAEAALELELQKNRNLILLFITLIGVLTTVFLYYFWKSKNKKEKLQTVYDTETRISKRLHDELANDVYNTMTFAETQDLSMTDKKEHFLNQIETIYNRTRNISLENSEIDTGIHFKENLLMLISSFNNEKTNIIIKNQEVINWNTLEKLTKITIYRIVQELLVNMKKHSQCSLAVFSFESKGKKYEIKYSDNGVGSPKTLKFKNGLQNVGNRIKTINGTFTFDNETQKGFKAKIIFPH